MVDPRDLLLQTTTTNASGYFEFTRLHEGDYLVAVDKTEPDRPEGWVISTLSAPEATVAAADNLTADFGFSPALDVEKTPRETSPRETRALANPPAERGIITVTNDIRRRS